MSVNKYHKYLGCFEGSFFLPLIVIFLFTGCEKKELKAEEEPKLRKPISITIVSGDKQVGVSLTDLSFPLTVEVKDNSSAVMPGVAVTWTVVSGGGTVSSATSVTDNSGRASTIWKMGTAGTQSVSATVTGEAGPLRKTFIAFLRQPGVTVGDFIANPVAVVVLNNHLYAANSTNVFKWTSGSTNAVTVAQGHQLIGDFDVDPLGTVYVTDVLKHQVFEWKPGASAGTVVAGTNAGAGANQLYTPTGVSLSSCYLYIMDAGNNRVQKWTIGCTCPETVAGGNGSGPAASQFDLNRSGNGGIDFFVGFTWVADAGNHRIQRWASGATSGITVAGGNGAGSAANQLNEPADVYWDNYSGSIYIADKNNHRVQRWKKGATSGETVAGGNGPGAANDQLNNPTSVFVDAMGYIYVADSGNNRILKFEPLR